MGIRYMVHNGSQGTKQERCEHGHMYTVQGRVCPEVLYNLFLRHRLQANIVQFRQRWTLREYFISDDYRKAYPEIEYGRNPMTNCTLRPELDVKAPPVMSTIVVLAKIFDGTPQ